jgi:hypothetical protein
MQRILIALDAREINLNSLDFACYISRLTKSKITGVFLENLVAENKLLIKDGYDATYLNWGPDEADPDYQNKMALLRENIAVFQDYCAKKESPCEVLCKKGTPARELIRESRFADLLITDSKTCFTKKFKGSPTTFEKDILKFAECPVIIAPDRFSRIDEIIFCYDGSRSSFFSIRQFDYIFPEIMQKNVILLGVNFKDEADLPEVENLKEWFLSRNTHLHFEFGQGKPGDELFHYLVQKENAIVIIGAYGRSSLSRLFRRTTANQLLKSANLAIFITHPQMRS